MVLSIAWSVTTHQKIQSTLKASILVKVKHLQKNKNICLKNREFFRNLSPFLYLSVTHRQTLRQTDTHTHTNTHNINRQKHTHTQRQHMKNNPKHADLHKYILLPLCLYGIQPGPHPCQLSSSSLPTRCTPHQHCSSCFLRCQNQTPQKIALHEKLPNFGLFVFCSLFHWCDGHTKLHTKKKATKGLKRADLQLWQKHDHAQQALCKMTKILCP